jgi:Rrf2 family protein
VTSSRSKGSSEMISQKARYAFKALIYLARTRNISRSARDIAADEQISHAFLEQILPDLKRAGLIHSRRGREGGHILAKDPASISFGQILRLIDGPVAPLPCLSITSYRRCDDCNDETSCEIRLIFGRAYRANLDVLEHTTLADVIQRDLSNCLIALKSDEGVLHSS